MLKTMHKLRALKCMLSVVCSGHKDLEGLNLNEESDIDIEQHLQVIFHPWPLSYLGAIIRDTFLAWSRPSSLASLVWRDILISQKTILLSKKQANYKKFEWPFIPNWRNIINFKMFTQSFYLRKCSKLYFINNKYYPQLYQ